MIQLVKSTFLEEEKTKEKLIEFIRNARTLSMGNECRKFENAFAKKQERAFAVFVNSGSSANLLLVQALINLGRLKRGDFVGVSALTWSTNIMPLIQLGLEPILIDCEVDTLNVSPRSLRETLEMQPNIKALFITNTLGLADDIGGVAELCKEKDIILLEDNCEALGSIVGEKLLGNFGLASTFSFFVGHHLSTIEGGMVCTDDEELYDALIVARSHGWDRHLASEKQSALRDRHHIDKFFAKYTFYDLGYNIRPTEINGFLGNVQIAYWDAIVGARRRNFTTLNDIIRKNKDLLPIRSEHMHTVSSFAVPVIARDEGIIERYKEKFTQGEVEIRPMIAGNMARQPFFNRHVVNSGKQPNAEYIHKHSFYFGNNPELTEAELEFLGNLLQG